MRYCKRILFGVFIIFLVITCGDLPPTPDIPRKYCEPNIEVPKIKDPKMCIESIKCYGYKDIIYSYGCFCDNLCLCFLAESEDCKSIEDDCNTKSEMFIMSNTFCSKDDILKNLINFSKKSR